jgi:hypothetical protein
VKPAVDRLLGLEQGKLCSLGLGLELGLGLGKSYRIVRYFYSIFFMNGIYFDIYLDIYGKRIIASTYAIIATINHLAHYNLKLILTLTRTRTLILT